MLLEGLGLFLSSFGFPSTHGIDQLPPLVCRGTMSSYAGKTEEASKWFLGHANGPCMRFPMKREFEEVERDVCGFVKA